MSSHVSTHSLTYPRILVHAVGSRNAAMERTRSSEAVKIVHGLELTQNDRDFADGKETNPIDARVSSIVNFDVIKDAYYTPSKYPRQDQAAALRAYFDPVKGQAARNNHHMAVNMINHLATMLTTRVITDEKHPAKGQLGVFALRDIPAMTVLGIYGGEITSSTITSLEHRARRGCERSPADASRACQLYIWSVVPRYPNGELPKKIKDEMKKLQGKGSTGHRRQKEPLIEFEILGLHGGNVLRFVNSFENVVKEDHRNVQAIPLWWKGAPRIVYLARRNVARDEELLVDYGIEHELDLSPIITNSKKNKKVTAAKAKENEEKSSSSGTAVTPLRDVSTDETFPLTTTEARRNNYTAAAIIKHRVKEGHEDDDLPIYEFLVEWPDGSKSWSSYADLVRIERRNNQPGMQYVEDAVLSKYLRDWSVSGSSSEVFTRDEKTSDGDMPSVDEKRPKRKKQEAVVAVIVESDEIPTITNDSSKSTANKDTGKVTRKITKKNTKGPTDAKKKASAPKERSGAFDGAYTPQELEIDDITDMYWAGPRDGYRFSVTWKDKTSSWEPVENLVDILPQNGTDEIVYAAPLLRYLKKHGITNPSDIIEKRIVPVRILRANVGPPTSRTAPPKITLTVELSDGNKKSSIPLESMFEVTVDQLGNREVTYKAPLIAFVDEKISDDNDEDSELLRFIEAHAHLFVE